MNRFELEQLLLENCVDHRAFSISGIKYSGDTLNLVHEDNVWKVFYAERDREKLIAEFLTEEEACEFLYKDFREGYGFIENTWDEIPYFKAGATFKSLEKHLKKEIANGVAEEVSILEENLPADFILGERMFRHIPSGKIWRLAKPEYPFRGFWKIL